LENPHPSAVDDPVLTAVLSRRDEFIRAAAEKLLIQPLKSTAHLKPSHVPAEAGVYMFYEDDPVGEGQPYHIGESKNLRQRIYLNQLRGRLNQSAIKRKLSKRLGKDEETLHAYGLAHLYVRWLILPLGRIEVEDYVNALFGIVESNPKGVRRPWMALSSSARS
jgi:hypothetical protein